MKYGTPEADAFFKQYRSGKPDRAHKNNDRERAIRFLKARRRQKAWRDAQAKLDRERLAARQQIEHELMKHTCFYAELRSILLKLPPRVRGW